MWSIAKCLVLQQKYPCDKMSLLWKIMNQNQKDIISNPITLAELALILPIHTADCERGFSKQSLIKSTSRKRIASHSPESPNADINWREASWGIWLCWVFLYVESTEGQLDFPQDIGNTIYSIFSISSSIKFSTYESKGYSLQRICLSSSFLNFYVILGKENAKILHYDFTKLIDNKCISLIFYSF